MKHLKKLVFAFALLVSSFAFAGLETGTYPSDLTVTNPTGGDPRSELDDHIRLVKSVTKAALPVGAPVYPLTSGTSTAASGTSVAFSSIPSWAKRITLMLSGVSTNGASTVVVQIGDAGGVEAAGYTCNYASIGVAAVGAASFSIAAVAGATGAAAQTLSGSLHFELQDAATNSWVFTGITTSSAPSVTYSAGVKALSATLDRIVLTTNEGHTFDAGSVNIIYE